MTKRLSSSEVSRRGRARRETALERVELRAETTPRASPGSPTSMPIKVMDEATRRLIDEALARRAGA